MALARASARAGHKRIGRRVKGSVRRWIEEWVIALIGPVAIAAPPPGQPRRGKGIDRPKWAVHKAHAPPGLSRGAAVPEGRPMPVGAPGLEPVDLAHPHSAAGGPNGAGPEQDPGEVHRRCAVRGECSFGPADRLAVLVERPPCRKSASCAKNCRPCGRRLKS